jgi:aminopeptidase N
VKAGIYVNLFTSISRKMKKTILFIVMLSSILGLTMCNKSIKTMLEPGVSKELAQYRKKQISHVAYSLSFSIPESIDSAITGHVSVTFQQARAMYAVILDFQGGAERIHEVISNGQKVDYQYINEHIIIPSNYVKPGENTIEIGFTATDQALNRSSDYMYSLFVPDRASTAFPCFDQPDLKASFALTLELPESWTAVSNGPLTSRSGVANRSTFTFAPDKPISTYLFAFAAGIFDTIQTERSNRIMTLFHRETDQEKLSHNIERIFQQHADALSWLESYTGIPYPFAKFDMVLIPGFQYSGMEHPGAIWYRDTRLLLDTQAPISQQLAKASLIAHETAHMWFGNLVTMQWFDDVWLKEVFAGLMADKIVHPQFPDINHDLQFILSHYPRAYAVDRSQGTHPIKQELLNLKQAGTLYGAIIYNKAPIVFQNLERLMGPEQFREAVREYLETYYLGNADWQDLAALFDKHSPLDVEGWSRQWIYGTGMPEVFLEGMTDETLRAARFLKNHEEFLSGSMAATGYLENLINELGMEENPQIMRFLISNMKLVFWRFFDDQQRQAYAFAVEEVIWKTMDRVAVSEKPLLYEALVAHVLTAEGISKMQALYNGQTSLADFSLTEDQRFETVVALMLRQHASAETLLGQLYETTTNADRKRRIDFVRPALSADPSTRDAFFNHLTSPANRRPEPWVLEALGYLHHPLRNNESRKYLHESLMMLEEVQRTGDIFFPLGWLEASLGGYGDKETADLINNYLETNPQLSPNLRNKVFQAADMLFRAADSRE